MDHIIEVTNLKKSYGSVEAVKDISFYVEPGKLFAFLGPNGAGKSTTIDMICTFLKPDGGSVTVDGFTLGREDSEIRKVIGAVFQENLLDRQLSVSENLECRGALYGLKGRALRAAARRAMEAAGVEEYAKRPYGKLSGGQRRRCDIARALLHAPHILFLDEPTTGLDPQTRRAVWETIRGLQREKGMTVFLTTHYMEEAAEADYVIVIDDGRVAAKGTPSHLRETYSNDRLKMSCRDTAAVAAVLDRAGAAYQAARQPDTLHGQTADATPAPALPAAPGLITVDLEDSLSALPLVQECRAYITGFEVTHGTMDDAFIRITGKELRQ